MPGRAAAWHPPILQGNEQSRGIKKRRMTCLHDRRLFFISLFGEADKRDGATSLFSRPLFPYRSGIELMLCSLPVHPHAEQRNKKKTDDMLAWQTSLFYFLAHCPSLSSQSSP